MVVLPSQYLTSMICSCNNKFMLMRASCTIAVSFWCNLNVFVDCCRANAEDALQRLQGTVIGAQSVRLSWGRSPVNKQVTNDVWPLTFLWMISCQVFVHDDSNSSGHTANDASVNLCAVLL